MICYPSPPRENPRLRSGVFSIGFEKSNKKSNTKEKQNPAKPYRCGVFVGGAGGT